MERSVTAKQVLSLWSQLADKGCTLSHSQLRDAARALLKLMPADVETLKRLKTICQELIKNPVAQPMHGLDSLFFSQSPSETCYNLVVCYSLLMPGTGECYSSREAFTRAI